MMEELNMKRHKMFNKFCNKSLKKDLPIRGKRLSQFANGWQISRMMVRTFCSVVFLFFVGIFGGIHPAVAQDATPTPPWVRKLFVNGVYWLFGIIPPEGGAKVDIVGDFETTDYGFHRGDKWQKRGLRIDSYDY